MAYNICLDADVILDVMLEREPFFDDSVEIFKLSLAGGVQLFATTSILLNVRYLCEREKGNQKANVMVKQLLPFFKICVTDKHHLEKAFSSNFTDIEDAVQYYSASSDKTIDFFVTRNIKDYKHADEALQILTPSKFLQHIK